MSPPSQVRASIQGAGGSAYDYLGADLRWALRSLSRPRVRLAVVSAPDGARHWIDPEGRISVDLNVPSADLAALRPHPAECSSISWSFVRRPFRYWDNKCSIIVWPTCS